MVECPTCSQDLSTKAGMRQHHTKVHNEHLSNRTCKGCGAEFYDEKARLNYCSDCNPNSGEHNGNWRGGREVSSCDCCSATFRYYPSEKDGIYCPECIESANGILPHTESEGSGKISTECMFCEAPMEVFPYRVDSNKRGVFCSQDCYADWLSETVVGEDHHQWEGGTINYGKNWWNVRRQALERDQYSCQSCGRNNSELGRNPDVHHLTPVRDFEEPCNAHFLENVVSLCRSCHRLAEEGTLDVQCRPEKQHY